MQVAVQKKIILPLLLLLTPHAHNAAGHSEVGEWMDAQSARSHPRLNSSPAKRRHMQVPCGRGDGARADVVLCTCREGFWCVGKLVWLGSKQCSGDDWDCHVHR